MSKDCPHCKAPASSVSKFGRYKRRSDRRSIQRYYCRNCEKSFSQACFQSCFRQKKRQLNPAIEKLLVSCVSQRRIAKLLNISRTTVARKFEFLSLKAQINNAKLTKKVRVESFQFDDLESFEHSKCKPLSVIMAVEHKTRKILAFRVSSMPAKGHLAKIAKKKYGYRRDERRKNRQCLFRQLQSQVISSAEIYSDQSPHYPADVKRFFPQATHKTCKGQRGCVVGQGELKAIGYDPLFSLNHSFAMLRANINRLVRRTWCTSKKKENLRRHIEIYAYYHNTQLT